MDDIAYYGLGAASGAVLLAAYWRRGPKALAEMGYLAFAVMLAIYVGAHLVSSETPRILGETGGALAAMAVAMLVRGRGPAWMGLLILGHGGYDFLLGHSAGVAPWYPPLCVGFDLVVGLGLIAAGLQGCRAA
jgi:hypothetical protein